MGPLRYLFVDMNSYFASVEQQERPELRGRPVGIVAVETDSTCCIAASYEAKHRGVRTGAGVREARRLCGNIQLVRARPWLYVQYHHRIVDAAEKCLHIDQVCSIDEFYGRLMGREREPAAAIQIAMEIKRRIREEVGLYVRCSVGLGPNIWLAKVATDVEKPDGLTVVLPEDLPHILERFELTDLPGIARRMKARLHARGVRSVRHLCALNVRQLEAIWGSRVLAEVWWRQLRGHDLPPRPTTRRTVGHSHVMAPEYRTPPGACAVLVRMIHKAAARMRRLGYRADMLTVQIRGQDGHKWSRQIRLGYVADTLSILQGFHRLWPQWPTCTPLQVSAVLSHLMPMAGGTIPLFPAQRNLEQLARTMDQLNDRHGHDTVHFASMMGTETAAPTRISFTQIPQLDDFEETDQ